MIKLTHNNTKYNLPENWRELTLGQKEDLMNLTPEFYEGEASTDYKIKYVSIVTGVDENKLAKDLVEEQLNFMYNTQNWQITTTLKPGKLNKLFKVGTELYYFNPNLNKSVVLDQFRDAFKIMAESPDFWNCAPGVLACIIKKVVNRKYDYSLSKFKFLKGKEKFDKSNYIKTVELEPHDIHSIESTALALKNISCADISGVAFFLSIFLKELYISILSNTLESQESPLIKAKIKEQIHLLNRILTENSPGNLFMMNSPEDFHLN